MKRKAPLYTDESKSELKKKLAIAVGQNIRAIREKRGMSMEELSHYLDTSRQSVFKIEKGEYAASLVTYQIIAEILKCNLSDLLPDKLD